MAKYFGAGIPLSTGFDVSAQRPLDSRLIAATIEERDAIPDIQKYLGMQVFVEENSITYQWLGDEWNTFGTNSDTVIENLATVATSGSYNDLVNKPANKVVMAEDEPTELAEVGVWLDVVDVVEDTPLDQSK